MNQPTEEQLQRFWTWCGFEPKIGGVLGHEHIVQWRYPNGDRRARCPRITLDNLFKWAVPKLATLPEFWLLDYRYLGIKATVPIDRHQWVIQFYGDHSRDKAVSGDDPALALFWAIWPIVEGEKCKRHA